MIKTPPGTANVLARAIDETALPDVLGTVAGDDTIFLAVRDGLPAADFAADLRHHLEGDT